MKKLFYFLICISFFLSNTSNLLAQPIRPDNDVSSHFKPINELINNTDNIYVSGQFEASKNIIKYLNPSSGANVDFNQVCVDSIWIDTSGMVHINIFNGNFVNMNYPVVSIVSPIGDTVSTNGINFFAHIGNSYLEYINTINDTSITDFSNYTFLMQNAFNPDTIAQIAFCLSTSIAQNNNFKWSIFPNPANDNFTVFLNGIVQTDELIIYDLYGKIWKTEKYLNTIQQISCSDLPSGLYILKLNKGNKIQQKKLMVVH